MPAKPSVLKRRIAPSVPLVIDIKDENDAVVEQVKLRVGFDFGVLAMIEEKSGLKMLGLEMWTGLNASLLGVMLWAACLPYNPEYEGDVGLKVIRSYLDKAEADKAADALWEAYLLYLPPSQRELLRNLRKQEDAGESPDPQSETAKMSESTGSPSTQSDAMISDSAKAKSAS